MDTIGNLLFIERTKKGLEIVDVEQATGIRGIYLVALEQGKYEVLPGEVYVKGFLRNYGNYLGLDGAHLVHLYSESSAPDVVPPPVTSAPPVAPVSHNKKPYPFSKKTISAAVAALILIVSVWSLYSWQKSSPLNTTTTSRETAAAKNKTPPTPSASAVNSSAAPVSSGQPTSSRAVVLVARYSDRCWTSVIADGKTLYEGIPQNAETLTWAADSQIVVNFGNAAAVELTLNGQPVGKIGERGDVVVKTFTAKGITSAPATPATSAPAVVPAPAVTPAVPAAPSAPGLPAKPGTPGGKL